MDNINNNLKKIVSSLTKIKAVNSKEDSEKLMTSVDNALELLDKLNSYNIEIKDDNDKKVFISNLDCLKQFKECIPSIIGNTIDSRDENSGISTTVWNWMTRTTSFSSEAKSNEIYKNGLVDMEKLIEKKYKLKFHDSLFTRELCDKLIDLYKKCIKKMSEVRYIILAKKISKAGKMFAKRKAKELLDKDPKRKEEIFKSQLKKEIEKKATNVTNEHVKDWMENKKTDKSNKKAKFIQNVNEVVDQQVIEFKKRIEEKKKTTGEKMYKKTMTKKTFTNALLGQLNISEMANELSKKFDSKGVSVTKDSIKSKAIQIINDKIRSKDTFYLSDIHDTRKEIADNCDCDKIYESIKSNNNYKYSIEEKIFENLSKNDIETAKKETEQHIFELIKKQVESRNEINQDAIYNIIMKTFEFSVEKFDFT